MRDCMTDEIRAEIEGMGWEVARNRIDGVIPWFALRDGISASIYPGGACDCSDICDGMSHPAPLRLFILLAKANEIEVTL